MLLRFQHQLRATAESEVSENLPECASSDREFPISADSLRGIGTWVQSTAAE